MIVGFPLTTGSKSPSLLISIVLTATVVQPREISMPWTGVSFHLRPLLTFSSRVAHRR